MKIYHYANGTCNASGAQIKRLREEAGWSQEQLAARTQLAGLNLNQKAISRIETGERVIPDYELLYFSEIFQVSVETLLKEDGSSNQ
ncbi:MAG: helix-turn-helix domain-containing protein [Lachnospiraceae bacterium]|nr:helix-turn-helix domain-containing protein [Lachnospiraceae bacterium]MCD8249718.1 helix-turn-helix domain-containing protein [Lachnospiraceae bacterium]